MKHLHNILNSLFFSLSYFINLKKVFLGLILGVIIIPLSLQAAALDPTSTCPGSNFDVVSGPNSIDGKTVGDPNYYQLTIPSSGDLTVTLTTAGNKPGTFYLGTSCDATDIYNGTANVSSHSQTFTVNSNTIVYAKISSTNANETFNITINFTPSSPPIMGDVPDQNTTNGSIYSLAISDYVTLTEGDLILSYTLSGTLPAGLTFNTSTGLLAGTPTTNGTFPLTVYATDDDGDSNTDTFTLTVAPKTPPIMDSIPDQTSENGAPYSLAISDYVTITDGDPILSYTLSGTLPAGLTFNTSTGLLAGAPTEAGIFSLDAYATDIDGDSNTISFTLTVGATAPVAVDDDVNTSKNIAVTIDILSNDIGGGTPVPSTVIITSNPNSGTAVLNTSTGVVTYTPDTDYTGTDSFTYTVNNADGIPSNVATVTINVNAPIAVDDNVSTPKNVDVNITVTANDTSTNSTIDVTTVTIIDNPASGSVTVDTTTGIVTYTPQTDWFGNETFTYTVDDANGITSNVATVTVSVISEQVCHDSATLLINATAYGDTATDDNGGVGLTSNDTKIYKVYLDIDGVLETNITNWGTEGIDFDFSKDCSALLTATRFGIEDGDSVSLPLVLDAGWYYMAFSGEKSNAATVYSVTVTLIDPDSGGGSGVIGGGDADIVNNFTSTTDYNNGIHYITTKVAGDPSTSITGVYLDDSTGEASIYADASGNDLWFMILPWWSDSTCSTQDTVVTDTNGDPLIMQIGNGSASVTASIQVPPEAIKDARFRMNYLDLGAIYAATGDQCILRSSTTGNLQGIGQCINSPKIHYEPNFGTPAYYRCIFGNGQPCLSSHHGYSCGPNDTTCPNYNPTYDNEYGCLMCTLGANVTCSSDNMSVRPDTYSMNLDNVTSLLTSGQFYDLDANATHVGGGTAPTDGYTIILDNNITTPKTVANHIFNPDASTTTCPPAGADGNFTIPFINGVGSTSIAYQNVGDVNITLADENWTAVDQKSPLECVPGSDSIATNPVGCLIKGTLQHRYIPGTFEINATLEDHNSADDFTYLNDTHIDDSYDDMAAILDVNVSAKSLIGETLSHYITGCYAQDTDLTLTLSDMNITYPGSLTPQALTQFLYYNSIDGEGNTTLPTATTVSGTNTIAVPSLTIDNSSLVFPVNAPDGNGTAFIEYKLNFDRKINLAVNPFQIVLTDLNITDNDGVSGDQSSISDQNATMYYARTRASKYFYEDVTTASISTPNIVDIYCNMGTDCLNYGVEIYTSAIDEANWFISTNHTTSDGNTTLMVDSPLIEGTGSPSVDGATNPTPTDITTWTNGIDSTVTVATEGAAVPLTVPIKIVRENDTPTPASWSNEWLIYNPDSSISAPSPFYKVRFIGNSVWTGTGNTGDVVNIDASKKKSKRMDW